MDTEVTIGTVSEAAPSDAGLSDEALLDQTLAASEVKADADIDTAGDEDPADGDEAVDEAIKAEEAKAAKVEEPAVVDPKSNGDTAKEKDEPAEDDEFTGNLSIHALKSHIAKDPALKAAIARDPGFERKLFHNARLAERSNQYDELFQTPALAKEAQSAADREYETGALYEGEDSQKFLEALVARSFEKDEQGRIKLDSNNQPINNGAYDRHMGHYRNAWYTNVEAAAKNIPEGQSVTVNGVTFSSEDVSEAIKILRAATEKSPATAGPATNNSALPKEVQEQLAELERLKASQKTNDVSSFDAFKSSVTDENSKMVEASVRALMAKRIPKDAALTDYFKDTIANDTVKSIIALAEKNRAHQDVINRAMRGAPRNAEGVKKIVAIHAAYTKELIGRELARVLSKAAPAVVAAAGAARTKVTQQLNQREVQASGGVSTPSRPDGKQLAGQIEAAARKSGKRLSDEEFLDRVVAASQVG